MLRAKTVGYCRYDGLDVYTDRIDNDEFDAAITLFSRRLGVKGDDVVAGTNPSGVAKNEYTFSNIFGADEIEVSYNPKTHLLVLGSKDRSQIEQFLSCVSGSGLSDRSDLTSDVIGTVLKGDSVRGGHSRGFFSSIKNLFGKGSGSSDVGEEGSVLDVNPSAYHLLDDREKKLIDSYESQLLDMERYVVRKNIVASYLGKVNRSLEDVAQMAEKYTIAEERGMDAHDRLVENAQFWKELDYVPSY
ncbi:MAG: hypothetical protein KAI18_00110 [Candidatus Aenigmarchaeota archaeon]|nr:hypothetical protein [Candidatus Aenigmarchaeota archaeon]